MFVLSNAEAEMKQPAKLCPSWESYREPKWEIVLKELGPGKQKNVKLSKCQYNYSLLQKHIICIAIWSVYYVIRIWNTKL